jgi:hypothetical protein
MGPGAETGAETGRTANLTRRATRPAIRAGRSSQREAHRNDEGEFAIGKLFRRARHRLGARQHGQRFLVERRGAGALHDAARQQAAFMIDGEGDPCDALLLVGARLLRVALEALDMGG